MVVLCNANIVVESDRRRSGLPSAPLDIKYDNNIEEIWSSTHRLTITRDMVQIWSSILRLTITRNPQSSRTLHDSNIALIHPRIPVDGTSPRRPPYRRRLLSCGDSADGWG